jgi:predicted ATP-grasp superfamily ATP-dependent carboligase
MSAKTVLITNGINDIGLATAKSFVARGYRVITISSRGLPFGWRSRYSAASYVLPETNQAEFEAGLLDLLARIRPDFFLPLSSGATFVACKHRESLEAITKMNVPFLDGFLAAYNKDICAAECQQLGIPCPTRYSLEQAKDVLERDRNTVLVVKPDCDAGAATGVRYVRDREQLALAMRECTTRFRGALIQEYVPGPVEAMKTVVVVFSRDGQLVAAFTTQKALQWPASGGATAVSFSTADERLVKLVLPFFRKWRWRGPAEVELKTDARTGQDKVIEINPRFPGYLRFALECGLDLPALVTGVAAQGEVVPLVFPSYRVGMEYDNPLLIFKSFLSFLTSGSQRSGESLAGAREVMKALPVAFRILSDPLSLLGRVLVRFQQGPEAPLFLVERDS